MSIHDDINEKLNEKRNISELSQDWSKVLQRKISVNSELIKLYNHKDVSSEKSSQQAIADLTTENATLSSQLEQLVNSRKQEPNQSRKQPMTISAPSRSSNTSSNQRQDPPDETLESLQKRLEELRIKSALSDSSKGGRTLEQRKKDLEDQIEAKQEQGSSRKKGRNI